MSKNKPKKNQLRIQIKKLTKKPGNTQINFNEENTKAETNKNENKTIIGKKQQSKSWFFEKLMSEIAATEHWERNRRWKPTKFRMTSCNKLCKQL